MTSKPHDPPGRRTPDPRQSAASRRVKIPGATAGSFDQSTYVSAPTDRISSWQPSSDGRFDGLKAPSLSRGWHQRPYGHCYIQAGASCSGVLNPSRMNSAGCTPGGSPSGFLAGRRDRPVGQKAPMGYSMGAGQLFGSMLATGYSTDAIYRLPAARYPLAVCFSTPATCRLPTPVVLRRPRSPVGFVGLRSGTDSSSGRLAPAIRLLRPRSQ